MKTMKNIVVGVVAALALVSCGTDYLDTENKRYLEETDAAALAAKNPTAFVNGMWTMMVNDPLELDRHDCFGYMSILHVADLNSGDMVMARAHWFQYDYEMDNRMASWNRTQSHWGTLYTMVKYANDLISLFPKGPETEEEMILVGQAQAVRGLAYMTLIQLYQNYLDEEGNIARERPGVPLKYVAADGKTPEEIEEAKGRNTVGKVFDQIQTDLENAVQNLTEAYYVRSSKNNIDANVAYGLLARFYLLSQQWEKAAEAANIARQGYTPMAAEMLHDGFMDIKNAEWMWGFAESSENTGYFASFFSHVSNFEAGYAGLNYAPRLIDASLYDQIADDDERKTLFNGPDGDETQLTTAASLAYASLKFGSDGNFTEDYVYMRASEMYLIEAEALAHLGLNAEAAQVLGELMEKRQPSWNEETVTVEDVLLQRRIELWGEGFAFFDLKRNNLGFVRDYEGTNHLEGFIFDLDAQEPDWTYQIPRIEIQENPYISEDEQND